MIMGLAPGELKDLQESEEDDDETELDLDLEESGKSGNENGGNGNDSPNEQPIVGRMRSFTKDMGRPRGKSVYDHNILKVCGSFVFCVFLGFRSGRVQRESRLQKHFGLCTVQYLPRLQKHFFCEGTSFDSAPLISECVLLYIGRLAANKPLFGESTSR